MNEQSMNQATKTRKHENHPGKFRAFVVSWLYFVFLSCLMTGQSQPRTIEKGDQSNIESPMQSVVRTDAEWSALWRKHAMGREKPNVDFSKEIVVAVFMGSRPNAGFSTTILSTLAVKGVLVVRYRETTPRPGALTAQILTFPYHIVAIPKVEVSDVRFQKTE
jgi:hypothetical protein